jgi:hypothetical protein
VGNIDDLRDLEVTGQRGEHISLGPLETALLDQVV